MGRKRPLRTLGLARASCFSLTKISVRLARFDTTFTSLAAGGLQRLNNLLMPLKHVWVAQNVG
jgi:hypothetical protein